MADLTTVSTFTMTVQGNRRVVQVDVSSAGFTTSDTVSVPHLSAISNIVSASWRTTAAFDALASTVTVGPLLFIGSSANAVTINRSSLAALPFRFTVEGN